MSQGGVHHLWVGVVGGVGGGVVGIFCCQIYIGCSETKLLICHKGGFIIYGWGWQVGWVGWGWFGLIDIQTTQTYAYLNTKHLPAFQTHMLPAKLSALFCTYLHYLDFGHVSPRKKLQHFFLMSYTPPEYLILKLSQLAI